LHPIFQEVPHHTSWEWTGKL